jgi:hypothetical protein
METPMKHALKPAHRRGIEYTPADLDKIQHRRPWEVLSGIVSPALLAKLALARETKVMGHEAKVFKGRQGDKQLEVVWLPGLQLAAKVTVTVGNRRSVSELRGFLVDTDAPSATIDAQLADYQLVDFADIGDMETSPAAVWLRQAAAPGHKHHE